MNILRYKSLPSTFTYICEHAPQMAHGTVVIADWQDAGRGQRGNSWESEEGKNLLPSLLVKMPGFPAKSQFHLSQAVAMGIVEGVREATGVECSVKWPNDIYIGDRKLSGIIISHSLQAATDPEVGATIAHTAIGFGLNVNQTEFRSDAPNPISLRQATGRDWPLEPLLQRVLSAVMRELEALGAPAGYCSEATAEATASLHARYMARLWRGSDGPWPFYDVLTGERFLGTVYAVEPLGHLVLRDAADSRLRRYAFKEVSWQ